MPARSSSSCRRLLAGFVITLVAGRILAEVPAPTRAETAAVVLNVRDFGAVGDGQLHPVKEWVQRGQFSDLRALRRACPFIDDVDRWTIDEAAFERAKRALPAAGGTIHFPAGHYVAGRTGWQILRDHVRLTGDGPDATLLSTAPNIAEALVLSPYRHGGWLQGARQEYPFSSDSGGLGEENVQLKSAAWVRDFRPGELVFVRGGANRFDQDYGEFNEVAGTDVENRLRFTHPLARDYTLGQLNWAGELAAEFRLPREGGKVWAQLKQGEGWFTPTPRSIVSVGDQLFTVEQVGPAPGRVLLVNPGRGNAPRGTVLPAGTKVAKARTVLKLTRTTRDFRCENLQIIGRRKVLNLSNSYDVTFVNCIFVRDLRDGGFTGGLTIDGDGGRFARFERCQVIARPAAGMQFARSFGDITFADCTFTDANVAFTEFCFNGLVQRCRFAVRGTPALTSPIIAGKSCGNLRFFDNEIHASAVTAIFDTVADIHSQRHASEGATTIRGNTIEAPVNARLFTTAPSARFVTEDNQVTRR